MPTGGVRPSHDALHIPATNPWMLCRSWWWEHLGRRAERLLHWKLSPWRFTRHLRPRHQRGWEQPRIHGELHHPKPIWSVRATASCPAPSLYPLPVEEPAAEEVTPRKLSQGVVFAPPPQRPLDEVNAGRQGSPASAPAAETSPWFYVHPHLSTSSRSPKMFLYQPPGHWPPGTARKESHACPTSCHPVSRSLGRGHDGIRRGATSENFMAEVETNLKKLLGKTSYQHKRKDVATVP